MKRVIVTGADGFIGRQSLLPLLNMSYEIHAVSNIDPPDDLLLEGVVWHKADLLEPDSASVLAKEVGATELLHFAWYVEHGKFWESAQNEVWLEASLRLINAFKENGGRRAVVAGSCVEYDLTGDENLNETDTPLNAETLYGRCKSKLRKELAVSGLDWAWGRVFFLFGEHENKNRLVASVINALLSGENAKCSHGNQIRDFLSVKDIGGAFAALLNSDVTGSVNIGSGEAVSIRSLAELINSLIPGDGRVQLGAIDVSENEPARIVADVKRLRDEVRWNPDGTLEQRLLETINWWKSQ